VRSENGRKAPSAGAAITSAMPIAQGIANFFQDWSLCELVHTRLSLQSLQWRTHRSGWVLGCEARSKGLVDSRSVQDRPRRGRPQDRHPGATRAHEGFLTDGSRCQGPTPRCKSDPSQPTTAAGRGPMRYPTQPFRGERLMAPPAAQASPEAPGLQATSEPRPTGVQRTAPCLPLRVLFVSDVRFLREGLAEILHQQ
jgi:hypothetical protein